MTRLRWFVALVAIMVSATACEQSQETTVNVGSPTAPSTNSAVISVRISTPETTIVLNTCSASITLDATVDVSGNAAKTVSWSHTGGGSFASQGNVAVLSITKNGTYTVTATSTADPSKSDMETIKVYGNCGGTNPPGPIPGPTPTTCNIDASPRSISSGGISILMWSSNGTVTSSWDGPKPSSGSQSVTPATTTTYRIDCSGPGGPEHEEVTVTVGTTNPTKTLAISPSSGSGQVGTTQQVNAICREDGNVVSCSPSWSSSAAHLVGVNSTGLVSYVSAGTAQICANWSGLQACGGFTATSAPGPTITGVTISPTNSTITLSGSPSACSATQQFTATVSGTGNYSHEVTWASSGGSISSTGRFTATVAGTYVVTVRSAQDGNVYASTHIFVTGSCQPAGVVSITVQPKTFTCSVGGQANLGANVTVTSGSNLSTAVTWHVSDTTIVSIKETNQNTVTLSCLKAGNVTVTARSVADPSKSDFGTGTVTTSTINCDWTTTTGLQSDGTVLLTKGQNISATAACTGGALPAWYSSDPSRVGVKGSQVTVINGKSFQTGNTSTISAVFTGQASVCVQAAIDETSPAFCRTVKVQ